MERTNIFRLQIRRLQVLAISVAVTIFMAACSENEETYLGREINFKTVSQKSSSDVTPKSKANVFGTIGSSYDEREHFGVFGYHKYLNSWDEDVYMDNVEISKVGADWKNVDSTFLWPRYGTLTFACYSPFDFGSGTVSANQESGIQFKDFTASTDANSQIDLMAADLIEDAQYQGTPVNVVFRHLLSQIRFTVACSQQFEVGTNIDSIIINNITIKKLQTKASYNVLDSAVWSDHHEFAEYRVLNADTMVNLDKTVKSVSNPLLVIPQDASGYKWNSENDSLDIFEIVYTIVFDGGSREKNYRYFSSGQKWQKGYIYTYDIRIGLNQITFSPKVSAWNEKTIGLNN